MFETTNQYQNKLSKVYNNTHRCKTRSVQRSTPQHGQKPIQLIMMDTDPKSSHVIQTYTIKHDKKLHPSTMDWFCWENLNQKPWFLPFWPSNIGLSGENFPIIQFYDIHMVSGPFFWLIYIYICHPRHHLKKSPETMKPWSHAARGDPKR